MPLPLVQFEKFGGRLVEDREGLTVVGASGATFGIFGLPPDPAAIASDKVETTPKPGIAAQSAIGALAQLDHAITVVGQDQRLSPFGREERLATSRENALKTLLASYVMVDENIKGLAQQEAQHYAVPPIDPSNLCLALRDYEIRNYVRSLRGGAKGELYRTVATGEDTALVQAILRSPLSFGNLEEAANLGWRARIDRENPVLREELNVARNSLDWAQKILGAVQGYMLPRLNFNRDQLLTHIGELGAGFFRFTPAEIAQFNRRRVAARRAAA